MLTMMRIVGYFLRPARPQLEQEDSSSSAVLQMLRARREISYGRDARSRLEMCAAANMDGQAVDGLNQQVAIQNIRQTLGLRSFSAIRRYLASRSSLGILCRSKATQTESSLDSDFNSESNTISGVESVPDADSESDPILEVESVPDADFESDPISEVESVPDADFEPDPISEVESVADADSESDTISEVGSVADSDCESDSDVDIILNGIANKFKCTICYGFLSCPVRTCENQHFMFCPRCFNRMENCPLCRGILMLNRFDSVEKMLESFTVPCAFKDAGCTSVMKASELFAHGKTCYYRPICCNVHTNTFFYCNGAPIEFHLYRSHLLDNHQVLHINAGEGNTLEIRFSVDNLNDNSGSWPPQAFTFDGVTFLVKNFLMNRMFYIWCITTGPRDDPAEYRTNVTIEADLEDWEQEQFRVGQNQTVYSPRVQTLQQLANAPGNLFMISLASLQRSRIIYNLYDDNIHREGGLPSSYRWTIKIEFLKAADMDN